ncbi:phosphoheptose isomerase [Uliginosibacterium sp. sgz301328]|uniref:phosphoheptose isomerase n=1 Tax=Uliginosibacterium sp. sgz301328 TaxID=3243764 RepID=UPI00359E1696
MDLFARISQHFQDSVQVKIDAAELLAGPILEATDLMVQSLLGNGKILACGNGGSAADAQRFAARLSGRFERERPELAALALGADSALLTSLSCDHDFSQVFAKQVRALGQPHDVLLVLCTSGESPNIIEAVTAAHERDMRVIALTGKGGGELAQRLRDTDVHVCVPSDRAARIEETHVLAIHCLCDGIDCMLMGEEI